MFNRLSKTKHCEYVKGKYHDMREMRDLNGRERTLSPCGEVALQSVPPCCFELVPSTNKVPCKETSEVLDRSIDLPKTLPVSILFTRRSLLQGNTLSRPSVVLRTFKESETVGCKMTWDATVDILVVVRTRMKMKNN